jgi:hypothetical protein
MDVERLRFEKLTQKQLESLDSWLRNKPPQVYTYAKAELQKAVNGTTTFKVFAIMVDEHLVGFLIAETSPNFEMFLSLPNATKLIAEPYLTDLAYEAEKAFIQGHFVNTMTEGKAGERQIKNVGV